MERRESSFLKADSAATFRSSLSKMRSERLDKIPLIDVLISDFCEARIVIGAPSKRFCASARRTTPCDGPPARSASRRA
ncbi:hypothetical protein ASE66_14470 [Bosea sp. Root483D1]|nr:hypothetical protein ASE66_14470 [Bosea sp. Root483D1]